MCNIVAYCSTKTPTDMEPKKYEHRRIERKIPLFFAFGLNVALFLTIIAFEWKVNPERPQIDPRVMDEPIDLDMVPVTTLEIPIPPKPTTPQFVPTKEEIVEKVQEEIIEEPKEAVEEVGIDDLLDGLPPIKNDEPEEIFIFVEKEPSYPGGWDDFYAFLGKNLKYPPQAKRLGIEGRVTVEFVIEKDGSITDLKVIKGLGAGLDEETIRVFNLLPKFNPGKQRGVPVRVRKAISIKFELNR